MQEREDWGWTRSAPFPGNECAQPCFTFGPPWPSFLCSFPTSSYKGLHVNINLPSRPSSHGQPLALFRVLGGKQSWLILRTWKTCPSDGVLQIMYSFVCTHLCLLCTGTVKAPVWVWRWTGQGLCGQRLHRPEGPQTSMPWVRLWAAGSHNQNSCF